MKVTVCDYFAELPPQLEAWIAGGAAVDYPTATDVDMWIMTGSRGTQKLEEWLNSLPDGQFVPREGCYEPGVTFDAARLTDTDTTTIDLIGTLMGTVYRYHKPLQIINAFYARIEDVMANFDLSICRRALSRNGTYVDGDGRTQIGELIQVVGPVRRTTYKRLQKWSIRNYELALAAGKVIDFS